MIFNGFALNHYFLDIIWSELSRESLGICFQLLFRCGTTRRFFGQKVNFQNFRHGHFSKKVSFRRQLDFWVTDLERRLIKVVRVDCTDH